MADNPDYIPVAGRTVSEKQARELNPLVLAYIGDSVQMLYARTRAALESGRKAGELHKMVSQEVKAHSQAVAAEKILPLLTPEEEGVFRRAKNSHTNNIAKNATSVDYRKASGYEALIGYLYISGQTERLKELTEIAAQAVSDDRKTDR